MSNHESTHVRMCGLLNIVLALLLVVSIDAAETAPRLVYGTYLGGRDKECATGIAVDRSGDAYVVGRTPSPDFPVTPHTFSTPLGGTRQHVLLLVLKDAAWQLCVGVVSGSIVAAFVTQPLSEVLPAGMKVLDPLSFGTVGLVLMDVGLVAATVPAWRASRIDPTRALRIE
jgi:hypothetical protein